MIFDNPKLHYQLSCRFQILQYLRFSECPHCDSLMNSLMSLRASLHDPGFDTDPGQFSVEFFVYMIPGQVRVGSISADPRQFLFRSVERAGNYFNHLFVLTLSAVLPMLFACAQLLAFLILMLMLQKQQLQATHRPFFFDFNRAATKLRKLNKTVRKPFSHSLS